MPKDVRKLLFSKAELLPAFQMYCCEQNFVDVQAGIEKFEITSVKSDDGAQDVLSVTVTFTSPDPKHPLQKTLDDSQIVGVLVTLCKKLAIPLPRIGQKFVKQYEDGLSMSMGMGDAELDVIAQQKQMH